MTERDPIEQHLVLARTARWAPEAAKARVRANLASGGVVPAASVARGGGVTKLTTALLVGASFVAGYWLAFQHWAEPREPAVAVSEAARAPERSTAASSAGLEATESVAGGYEGASTRGAEAGREASTVDKGPVLQASASRPAKPQPRATPTPPARATPGRARVTRVAAAPNDPVSDELQLLARAERAIRSGEALLALSFLDELDARFPRSAMLEERAAAHLLAGCALSNPGARRRAELFLSDRAASVYTDRVRRSCGIETPATTNPSPASETVHGSSRSGH
jgi:hypothetical protein